jgi:hypothetical protein
MMEGFEHRVRVYGYSPAVGEQVGKCEFSLLKNAKSFLWFRIF